MMREGRWPGHRMKLFITIFGMILIVAWPIERWYVRRTERERARDRELGYLAGTKRWWQEPPGDGPEGDH